MVIPAPVIRKPYDCLVNPYPSSCSRLCNHPVSKELKKEYKDVLKKTKDTHVSTKPEEQSSFLLSPSLTSSVPSIETTPLHLLPWSSSPLQIKKYF